MIHSFDNFRYSILPFSSLTYPEGPTTFTVVKEGDYCETSHIIKPNSSLGAIINHGRCSIYIEAQNLAKVGYRYVLITGFDANSWQSDETSLNIFVATIPLNIFNVITSRNIEEMTISIFPTHADRKIFDCQQRFEYLLANKMLSNFYSIARSCISLAISQMESENRRSHDLDELNTSSALAKMLWDNNMFDEANLLIRWVSFPLFSIQLYDLYDDIISFGSILREIISLLFTFGEWGVAADLLATQINQLCSLSETNILEICSQQCIFLFLTSMGTLSENFGHTTREKLEKGERDWVIPESEDLPREPGEGQNSHSPLFYCFNHYEKLIVDRIMSIDSVNSEIIEEIAYFHQHPSLWLAASELTYMSKKYGVLNIIAYILEPVPDNITLEVKSTKSPLHEFSNFLSNQFECQNSNRTSTLNKNSFLFEKFSRLRVEFVPQISLNQLKKNLQLGRNRLKHSEILLSSLRGHIHQDMIEIHTRLAIYWDEYGSFPASQRHTLRKLSLLSSQVSTKCLTPQMIHQVGCLFERLLVATPMIFSLPDEFTQYRNHQITSLRIISNIILNISNQFEQDISPPIANHFQILAVEKSITSTPPSMMIGYQYEFQDFGDRALPPAAAVAPSSSEILSIRHKIERSCLFGNTMDSYELITTRRDAKTTPLITLGFISRFFYEHSVGRLIQGVIIHLNPRKFNVIVFCLCCQNDESDDIQRSIKDTPMISWVDLPGNLTEWRSTFQCSAGLASNKNKQLDLISKIKSSKIDILIYPEIGMDSLTLNFAALRLASVQVVYWGHPISQRLPSIDYFISSELFDLHHPKCQYPRLGFEKCPFGFTTSEQIIYLRGLTTVFSPSNIPSLPNSSFNPFMKYFSVLPENSRNHAHIYLLPHTIMKYSTAFIRTLATLLLRDQNGILIILYSSNQYLWYQKLQRSIGLHLKKLYCQVRLPDEDSLFLFPENMDSSFHQKFKNDLIIPTCYHPSCGLCCDCEDSTNLESALKRILLIPKVGRDLYLSMISFGSVILDPFPFGMGVTAMESFILGTPVITLPSHQSTLALTYGMIRHMGLDHQNYSMVARTVNEYLEFGIRVATTGKFRNEILETIKSRAHLLLNDFSTVHDWEVFFQNVQSDSNFVNN